MRVRDPDGTTRLLVASSVEPLRLRAGAPGLLVVTLLQPDGCEVVPPNPRTLRVEADDVVSVEFEVRCGPSD